MVSSSTLKNKLVQFETDLQQFPHEQENHESQQRPFAW
jgi:hypothetical protein